MRFTGQNHCCGCSAPPEASLVHTVLHKSSSPSVRTSDYSGRKHKDRLVFVLMCARSLYFRRDWCPFRGPTYGDQTNSMSAVLPSDSLLVTGAGAGAGGACSMIRTLVGLKNNMSPNVYQPYLVMIAIWYIYIFFVLFPSH